MGYAWKSRRLRRSIARVPREVRAIEVDRASQTVLQRHRGCPTGRGPQLARVGIETADVDRLLLGRPIDGLEPPSARNPDQRAREILQADRLRAADVEDFAAAGVF